MTTFTNPNSSDDEFYTAARFFPSLHACIIAAFHEYQPQRVSLAQVKSIAVLQTAGKPFVEKACCGFKETVEAVSKSLGIEPAKLREMTYMRTESNEIIYPMYQIRYQSVKFAMEEARKRDKHSSLWKLILACSWGMYLFPGNVLADYFSCDLVERWKQFCGSPIIQTELFMKHMDHLMEVASGDFDLAASMYYAGNEQKTKTDFGKRASATYNRLINAGHRAV